MQDQNTNPINPVTPSNPVVSPTTTTTTPPQTPAPVAPKKPAIKLPGIKLPENLKNNPRIKKVLIASVSIIVFLILLSIIAPFLGRVMRGQPILPTPSPSPTPLPTPPSISNPSPYAEDEEVLSIKKDLEELDKRLIEANFREDELRVPSLDWDVRFQ